MDVPCRDPSNTMTKVDPPIAFRTEMGDFAFRMWDKTQFGVHGKHMRAHLRRLLRS
jgi:hypothetical protein